MKPDIRVKYFEVISTCLQSCPNELKAFVDMWNEEKYRRAYLFVMKLEKERLIELPNSFSEIDKSFFWKYVW